MDKLNSDQIQELAQAQDALCLTLYMPTHRGGSETLQGPVLWKNLLREAAQSCEAQGEAVPDWLKALEALAEDYDFWQHQSDGLAVFAHADGISKFRLPFSFSAQATIARGFALRPLLQYRGEDREFFLLALSQKTVRLWRCSQHAEAEVALPGDVVQAWLERVDEKADRELQHHSGGAGNAAAVFHGSGGSDADKARLRAGLERLDNGLEHLWKTTGLPVVLAAVEALAAAYRGIANYPRFAPQGVNGNPDHAVPAQLRAAAWAFVAADVAAQRQAEVERWQAAAAHGRGSSDPAELQNAAQQGRLDTLLLNGAPDSQDPSDTLLRAALATGARVLVYDATAFPAGHSALGVYRY
ncbi:MAG: hypothetical protein OHK0021_19130 [Bryobacter sp.]